MGISSQLATATKRTNASAKLFMLEQNKRMQSVRTVNQSCILQNLYTRNLSALTCVVIMEFEILDYEVPNQDKKDHKNALRILIFGVFIP